MFFLLLESHEILGYGTNAQIHVFSHCVLSSSSVGLIFPPPLLKRGMKTSWLGPFRTSI